ncbi:MULTISPECIES: hypothetical protein [unclassified Archaeoglobus]|jgi:hypothetical protein|uniref:hypothetical protein n=1 Tax=unclassified Archaeoglobus TaxID=2643606 RepID=UPI0025B80A9C|nr:MULTISPECIES: hypothetical protein [unclassified Archaeoglobus]
MSWELLGVIASSAGIAASLLLLYLFCTLSEEEFDKITIFRSNMGRFFACSALAFILNGFTEALELFLPMEELGIEELLIGLNTSISVFITSVTLYVTVVLWKVRGGLGSGDVFFGRFGISLLYISVFTIAVIQISEVEAAYYLMKKTSEALNLLLIPVLIYLTVNSLKYDKLVSEKIIFVPYHTLTGFIGVVIAFILFHLSLLALVAGSKHVYNVVEAGALVVFILASYYYGSEVEKAVRMSESG